MRRAVRAKQCWEEGAEKEGIGEQLWSQSEELIWDSNRQQGIVAGLETFLTILTQLVTNDRNSPNDRKSPFWQKEKSIDLYI